MLKRLAKETVIYGFGQVSQQVLALVTLPIFARLLSPADYGLIDTAGTVTIALGIFASMQMTGGMQRNFFLHQEKDPARAQGVLVTAVLFVLLLDLVLLLGLWPLCEPVMRYLQGGPGSGALLQAALSGLMATTMLTFLQEVHRLSRRPWWYVGISLLQSLVWMACGLYFVFWAKGGALGYLWGGTLAVVLTLPLAYFSVRKELRGSFHWDDLKDMLKYSLPWIPTAASAWLITLADRLVLNHWVGLEDIGYYGIAQKVTRMLAFVTIAFGSAWTPFIFSLYAKDEAREKVVRAEITTTYLFGLAGISVVLTALAPWLIVLLASSAFLPAASLVGPLCLGVIGFGVSNTLSTGLCLIAETRYVAVFTGICGVTNIVLNLLLVPWWGAHGSAWATAFSYLVLNGLYYYKTQQLIPTPFAGRRLATTAAITVAAIAALGLWDHLAVRLAIMAGFFVAVWVGGGVDRRQVLDQSREALGYLKQRLRPGVLEEPQPPTVG